MGVPAVVKLKGNGEYGGKEPGTVASGLFFIKIGHRL